MNNYIKKQGQVIKDAMDKSKNITKEHFNLMIEQIVEKKTKSDMLYEASAKMNKEEFRKVMNEEYDKVVEDPNYFFKNYFKTKWNENTSGF